MPISQGNIFRADLVVPEIGRDDLRGVLAVGVYAVVGHGIAFVPLDEVVELTYAIRETDHRIPQMGAVVEKGTISLLTAFSGRRSEKFWWRYFPFVSVKWPLKTPGRCIRWLKNQKYAYA